ncbi:MAG: sigma 54-interacting transcriptional regulator [Negativicutes bacterium]|nr:sigma 54-interacting transcriptional regulator [Negativicutes bacterium]
METTNHPFINILVSDDQGLLVYIDDRLKNLNIPNSLVELAGTKALPKNHPVLYHTAYGLLIIYSFSVQTPSANGYIGLLVSKDLRDEAVNRLIENNLELETIIEEIHDGIVVADGEGELIRINKGFERLSGIPRETMLHRHVSAGVERGAYSASATLRVLETKKPVTFYNEYHHNDQIHTGVVTGRPLFDENNNIIRVVCNIRDITEINKLRDDLLESQLQIARYSRIVEMFTNASNSSFIYTSKKMQKLVQSALKYAKVDAPLLITGESGSGKEVFADLVHRNSSRKDAPFLKINCGAIPEALLESELFGYEAGAFTGAKKGGHMGLFELAHHGTILLDEIGELSMALQSKLLRFVEKKEFYRVGSNKQVKVDVRLISATNRNLEEMIAANQFRLDLFYRLNVFTIPVPPLRERKDDLVPLVEHFVEYYNKKYKTNKKISSSLLNMFLAYPWPGNIRELENLIERLVVISDEENIFPQHLPDDIFVRMNQGLEPSCVDAIHMDSIEKTGIQSLPDNLSDNIIERFPVFHEARDFFERMYLSQALEKYGSVRNTAMNIGLSHPAILKKFACYGEKSPMRKK